MRTRAQCIEWTDSVLCSKHFTETCFEPSSVFTSKVGLEKHRSLKSDSVPTIFEWPVQSLPADTSSDLSSHRKWAAAIVFLLRRVVMQSNSQREPEEIIKREKDPG